MPIIPASSQRIPRIRPVGGFFAVTRQAALAWNSDNALRLSAALAYYSIFSIAPLLIISIGIAGIFLGDEAATNQIYEAMRGYVGEKAAAGVQDMVESAAKPKAGVVATIVGSATLLLGASGLLAQLRDALNSIWEVEAKSSAGIMAFVRTKFFNLGLVIVMGFLLLTSLLLSSLLASLNQSFDDILQLPAWIWSIVTLASSIGMASIIFGLCFKVLPDAKVRWWHAWVGGLFTAVLFEIGKFALGWYLGRESTSDAYGSAGSVVLLILWVYYASCILMFGAEFTQMYAASKGEPVTEPKNPTPKAAR